MSYMFRLFVIFISVLFLATCKDNAFQYADICKNSDLKPSVLVAKLAKEKNFPGMAVAIAYKGEVQWTYGYGMADIASSAPVDPEKTKFRIGSTSKALTAFALSVLKERDQLKLNQPINLILSDLPPSYEGINLRQLAGHLAGVRHYIDLAELDNKTEYHTSADALGIFVNDALISAPDSNFIYSTYGYTVISAALEKVTGTHFLDLMNEVVFEPLGMANTMPDISSVKVPERTEFYYRNENSDLIIGDKINNSYKWAGGGFLASVTDLAQFGISHFDEKKISLQIAARIMDESAHERGSINWLWSWMVYR